MSAETPFLARTKSFVSRSRQLSPSQQAAWDKYAANYLIEEDRSDARTTVSTTQQPLDLAAIFGREAPVRCEIGSGNGDQIIAAAASHRDRDYLAVEVYHLGVAKTIQKAHKAQLTNLKILNVDAQQALPVLLPPASLDELWVFFPDPWRKTRHHKRRLVQPEFGLEVARMLRPGAVWRLATDWEDYAFHMRDVVESCPQLVNPYAGMNPDPADPQPGRGGFAPRWSGRVLTNFERRGLEAGRVIRDVCAQRCR